jgi:hypothetical protein
MEAATVAGRAAAPASPPRPARVPRDRPRPGRKAPVKPPRKAKAAAPARKPSSAPARRASARSAVRSKAAAAPARGRPRIRIGSPLRSRSAPQLIPIAVGTAAAVRQFPDSSLMVRMTQGRLWIGVLGVLLVGIVGLNVFTLSLTAEAGHVEQNIVALEKENTVLATRDAQRSGAGRVRHDASAIGLEMAAVDQVSSIEPGPDDVAVAAQRLGAAGY